MKKHRIYAMDGFDKRAVLAHSDDNIADFFRVAGTKCHQACERLEHPRGAYLCVEHQGDEVVVGIFAVNRKGELFAYIGQGYYEEEAVTLEELGWYIEGAIESAQEDA